MRIIRCIWWGFGIVTSISLAIGGTMLIFGNGLLGLFSPDPEVIEWGMRRIQVVFILYFICGWMDIISGGLRGLGYSILPTVVVLLGVCVFRIAWIAFVFPHFRSIATLIWAYPISWSVTVIAEGTFLYFICKKMRMNYLSTRTSGRYRIG